MKISLEAVARTYPLAKKVHAHKMKWKEAIDQAELAGGMSRTSAHNFIQNYRFLIAGDEYHRTMSVEATESFLRLIYGDFGKDGLIRAINAVRKHVDYYASLPNGGRQRSMLQMVDRLEKEFSTVSKEIVYPDDLHDSGKYSEGAKKKVVVNAYERNPQARRICLSHYGDICAVCKFVFADKYGDLGKDFIHVHHIVDLAEADGEYEVDPIHDLRPVCPNCHAMLHRKRPAYTIEELKSVIKEAKGQMADLP
ncbi:MAG: HNH endonuclease [Deltaproteobacteria bacterium]|nr:HNH endonuclease [Deltaproteobacteria bacterium]